ncbi:MAG: DUF5103 domain-containing protein [Bacteroidetes bacterium]|nr:DUF5103 domain-containing protein [Bacteroidota bacterium]
MKKTDYLRRIYVVLLATCLSYSIWSQEHTGYYQDNFLRYADYVYKPNIKTVLLNYNGVVVPDIKSFGDIREFQQTAINFTIPVVLLNSDKQLKLSFDDFDLGIKNFNYTLVHCDAYWNPSSLQPNEYLDGFFENNIYSYQFSLNTLQRYVHYSVVFPGNNFKITKSGNYLVKVYENNNPDDIVLTKRFMVFDEKVTVAPTVTAATNVSERYLKQEVDLRIVTPEYEITNAYKDLKIVITQNDRWDNALFTLKPTYVKHKELVYDYDTENLFSGGNEFRSFDCRNIRYQTMNVKHIETDSTGFHMFLLNDEKRSSQRYSTQRDINGKFLIKTMNGNNSDIEAEYVYVHFFVPIPEPTMDGTLYVVGGFVNWQCGEMNKMTYNHRKKGYECTIYVKQGYYDYKYVLAKDGTKNLDEGFIEGEHFETENEYVVYVYHQSQLGLTYDQLIGVQRVTSVR